jgi:uncharacterized membrane protein
VGARCPTCARVRTGFVILLKPRELALAVVYGVGAAAIGTLVLSSIPLLGWLGFALLGFGTGEAVMVGANRRRVPELAPIAVACFLIGYELGSILRIVIALQGRVPLGTELILAPIVGLFGGLAIVGVGVGAFLAWMRAR